jgi:hypothetical protein
VTNDLSTPLINSSVSVLFPLDVTPTVPTNFTVPSLGPGANETFTIPAQAGAVPELYVISAEASSAVGGISSSSPITVNATDPSMAPIELRPAGQLLLSSLSPISPLDATNSTGSNTSTSIGTTTTTCSTTSSSTSSPVQAVPEFSGVPPLVAAAALFALIALGGLVIRVRKGREVSQKNAQ